MKKLLNGLLMLIMALSLCACAKPAEPAAIDLESAGWDAIVEAAKGSTVTFYGWGGDENRNNWLNTTVADYVLKRRISYSQQLMETDLSLADICFHSGFGSVSSFIRSFKSIMGMSPSKYRRMQQEIAQ